MIDAIDTSDTSDRHLRLPAGATSAAVTLGATRFAADGDNRDLLHDVAGALVILGLPLQELRPRSEARRRSSCGCGVATARRRGPSRAGPVSGSPSGPGRERGAGDRPPGPPI